MRASGAGFFQTLDMSCLNGFRNKLARRAENSAKKIANALTQLLTLLRIFQSSRISPAIIELTSSRETPSASSCSSAASSRSRIQSLARNDFVERFFDTGIGLVGDGIGHKLTVAKNLSDTA